jgi:predicted short-subunit dehydrogenase-like oxidoreductase (DUF2520 family)
MPRAKPKHVIEATIVGSGTLATALAIALERSGHRVLEIVARYNDRSIADARKLARLVGARATTSRDARLSGKVIWICVPDDAISGVATQLLPQTNWRGKIAVHSSGALGSDVLAPLKKAEASIASAHPLMTFVRMSKSEMDGVPFALEGDPKALAVLRAMVRSLGGKPFPIAAEVKPVYHLFGFFSSPALIALMVAAQQVAELAGFDRRRSRALMEPIVRQTVENFFRSTPQEAFSGPLRRGDLATLRKHLDALQGQPELLKLYKSLTSIALKELPVTNAEALRKLIG